MVVCNWQKLKLKSGRVVSKGQPVPEYYKWPKHVQKFHLSHKILLDNKGVKYDLPKPPVAVQTELVPAKEGKKKK